MATIVVALPSAVPAWWIWLACACALALIPLVERIGRSPARRRILAMLILAGMLGAGLASAQIGYDPPAWCCTDLIIYGLCWLPFWC